ncbi:orotidine-5'-phosphate decarboxylase [Singulisphaera acidiphila]|uniref:Orotidine 5'-phosphate decarboxylase n=1 Tax=Singulisphaera acidiphila (strain ATCC BAA-1392 / DSM 18658 / VKM B-2454 / MOB10) TaxID=886293 RepID=L0DQ41_SINAD|nr:orotidine-5'-phosphate decarboxylase [Singulisphaera acidiphila]AGA30963.1 orotidine 5''-phosphate decarboxylase, subfamily 2 [Singulisphaera acidiphila DSM 18658]
MHFADRLNAAVKRVGTPICVGIDPRPEDLPPEFLDKFPGDRPGVAESLRVFGDGVVDVVAPLVPIVKFQAAFYEAYGPEGFAALHATAQYAQGKGLLVLIDGKRNDIGSTADAYARAYLGKVPVGESFEPSWNADGLTVNPYLGSDGITPFVKVAAREGKGLYALVRTSNASAGEFQDLIADGKAIYQHVAQRLAQWAEPYRGASGYSLLGAVVGATYPDQLAELRATLPGIPFLVPGYGTQGGSSKDVAPAFDTDGLGAIINNSRGLTYAYSRPAARAKYGAEWQAAIEGAVHEMIADLAENTNAGKLRTPTAE